MKHQKTSIAGSFVLIAASAAAMQDSPPEGNWSPLEATIIIGSDSAGYFGSAIIARRDTPDEAVYSITTRKVVRPAGFLAPQANNRSMQTILGLTDEQVLLGLDIDPQVILAILDIDPLDYLPPETCPEDVNRDGVVDLRDLNRVMANFGKVCD